MQTTPHARKTAPVLACERACLRFRIRPNAFGNALGDAFVSSMGVGRSAVQGAGMGGSGGSGSDYQRWLDGVDNDNYTANWGGGPAGGNQFSAASTAYGVAGNVQASNGYARNDDYSAGAPRSGMIFTDGGWIDPNGGGGYGGGDSMLLADSGSLSTRAITNSSMQSNAIKADSLVTNGGTPKLQYNMETGTWGYDQGNDVWAFPVEDRRSSVIGVPLPALNGSIAGDASSSISSMLPNVGPGFFRERYNMAIAGVTNPNSSFGESLAYFGLATGMAGMTLVEDAGTALINSPRLIASSLENGAGVFTSNSTEGKVVSGLTALRDGSFGLLGLTPLIPANRLMGPMVRTTEEMAVAQFPGAEATAAARATYAVEAEVNQASRLSATFQGRTIEPQLSGQNLFHGNSMSWDDIVAAGGLPEKGTSVDMLNHLNGGTNSAFRGTNRYANSPIRDGNGPVEWAGQGGTVVQIDGRMVPNYDANALTAGRIQRFDGRFADHMWAGEAEFPIHARVPIESITHYGNVVQSRQGLKVEQWIPNPSYKKAPQ